MDSESVRLIIQQLTTSVDGFTKLVGGQMTIFQSELKSIDQMLRGDTAGQNPGLVSKVTLMAQKIELITQDIDKIKSQQNKVVWYVVGLLVSIVTGLIGLVFSTK
jgi:hypothetical protein